ncbi:hypothetical protein NLJ89_g2753 [Agrocybe chaxingu]|uniref:Uncharacterized protein n=1 Tax=Agrocybe chaxingu TaxID=84603 RepID=A0A9W8MXF4_9AGAR|nr:hypothetical protein NLJ89_g2753 [Agrocybe chaxingu]
MHGITLHNPPKGELFATFHAPAGSATSSSAMHATPVTPMAALFMANLMVNMGTMNPFMMPPWFMGYPAPVPTFQMPGPQTVASTPHCDELPSSDPPDVDMANPYPDIESFLKKLTELYLK